MTTKVTPKREGALETLRRADGTKRYRGRIYLADETRIRIPVPDDYSEERARDYVHAIQEQEDKHVQEAAPFTQQSVSRQIPDEANEQGDVERDQMRVKEGSISHRAARHRGQDDRRVPKDHGHDKAEEHSMQDRIVHV